MVNFVDTMGQVHSNAHLLPEEYEIALAEANSGELIWIKEQHGDRLVAETNKHHLLHLSVDDYLCRGLPKFHPNEIVKTNEKGLIGAVKYVVWHFNRKCFYYILVIDGKDKTRWYFDDDISKVE